MSARAKSNGNGDIALPEPARKQLLDLAADLVGRLPADEVPAGLRAIARFAPAKRKRLGAVALRATLDGDEAFRAKVADAVVTASPALAESVAAGATAASDPLDVIVVAYLTRPDGWAELIEKETARWSADRSGTADEAEVRQLREEVARLRATVRTEPARVKQAVADALTAADQALAEARRNLRDRTRDLRAAERGRDAATAARDELQRRLDAQAATHDAELRRLRTRLADLERTAEAARRDVRNERELDEARLWLLTETLVQAAGGLRRELSLAPPSTAPADTVAASTGGTAARTASDAAGLERLLALPNVHLIIDGYNVTKSGYGEQALADQRTRLIGQLAGLAGRAAVEITVAFDGGRRPTMQPATPRGVRVLFSQDEIADDLIRRLVAAEPPGRPVVVVTSDQQIVTDVTRAGAWTAPSAALLALLG
jgi:hypothetical protein